MSEPSSRRVWGQRPGQPYVKDSFLAVFYFYTKFSEFLFIWLLTIYTKLCIIMSYQLDKLR